jgi:DNA polymerase elongation subunit (family B)
MLFQALTWEARDEKDEEGNVSEHQVSVFGKTEAGKSVCVSFNFNPYLFVRIPDDRPGTQREILRKIEERCPGCVVSATLEHKKDMWGYSHGETFPFLRIESKALAHRKQIESFLRRIMYLNCKSAKWQPRVYEANLDPCLAFMHRSGISSTGWLDTGDECRRCNLNRVDIDLWCVKWETLRPVDRDDVAPFVLASFDIECNSSTGKFPDPHVQDDACFQIGVTLCEVGKEDEPFDKTCFCYKKTSGLEGTHVHSFDTEREMLEAFGEYLHEKSIDIMYGWNIFGFDLEYIITRAMIVKCSPSFFCLGRIKDRPSKLVYKTLSSSALGDNNLKLVPMPGRFIFDMFHETKKNYKLDSYSLNAVSKKFLGDQKIDMPPKEMFKRFREGDADKLAEVAEYCVKDTLLPHLLLKKMCTLLNMLEMAKATYVPLQYLVERGQQIKVFSQLCKKADQLGFRVPTLKYGSVADEGYVGATVLEAQTGAYYTPITALDFASLYPSIMMAHNLCYSTLVMDAKYGHLEGVEYEEFQVGEKKYKFVQNVPSVLPNILNELKAFRKKAKKDMANATGFMKDVYNGKQLAFKISMNSMYGFTGASKGMLPCMAIASTTTSKGRSMIEETKNYVEKNFPGAIVRYGDSVTPDTPLLIRKGGVLQTCRIDSLVKEYTVRDDGKEIAHIDAEVWTEDGFTRIEQIVRHKTVKNIHRVLTHTGVVDVTEDHSLLLCDKNIIKPSEVSIGMELLHGDCVSAFHERDCDITVEEAKVMGFFFGDGSCGAYHPKYTWALNNSNLNYLEEMKRCCPFPTKIYDTMKSSGVYKLNACGNVKEISQKYRRLFYNDHKEKIVPAVILNAPHDIVRSFVDGYYMADGDKGDNNTRMDIKGKEGSMGMFILGRRLGYKVSINTRLDKTDVFRQTWTLQKQRKNVSAIKKIELLEEESCDYVYDLTTESHHFHVGPGDLVVHNTDSVMVEFDVGDRKGIEAVEYSWELGERAAEECTALFKKPNDLELEKVYCPYFLYSKKRYAAKLWEKGKSGQVEFKYIDVKGLQLVRRDNTPHVRRVLKEVLDCILASSDPKPAIDLARERAMELLTGDVSNEELILSQSLADSYKNPNLAHVQVRNKIRDRAPGSEPQSGDRVPYILTKTDDPKAKAYEKAEDPKYVEEHGVPVDYHYYFMNKFLNPVCDLVEPLVKDPKQEIFGEIIERHKPPKKKRAPKQKTTITSLFKAFEERARVLP